MLKIILGFIVIAGLTFYLLSKGGGNIDLGGEKHGVETHDAAPATGASAPAVKH